MKHMLWELSRIVCLGPEKGMELVVFIVEDGQNNVPVWRFSEKMHSKVK